MSENHVTLRRLISVLWGDRWLIIVLCCLAVVIGIAYALTRKPLFESKALLASARDDASQLAALSGLMGQFSGLAGALGVEAGTGTNLDETVAVLLSREFSAGFIERHKLLPLLVPELQSVDAAVRNTDSSKAESGHAGSGQVIGMERAIERLDRVRAVTVDRRTSFVKLAVRASTPEGARRLATDMIEEINAELRERALLETASSIELLRRRMAETPYESLRAAAANLLEAQLKREVMIRSRDDFALRVLDSPSLPEQRAYPYRKRIVAVAAIVGFMLALLVSLSRSAWRGFGSARRAP